MRTGFLLNNSHWNASSLRADERNNYVTLVRSGTRLEIRVGQLDLPVAVRQIARKMAALPHFV